MKDRKTHIIQALLFIFTLLATTLVGTELILGGIFYTEEGFTWANYAVGLYYSVPFLGFLTAHEFGHYLTARWYKIKVTLPYYIPFYLPLFFNIGTMGAFIKIKEPIKSRKEFFDVGIAGPLAGFVVAIGVLWYGFTHLPPAEYIFEIHPEYLQYGEDYAQHAYKDGVNGFALGTNLVFEFFKNFVVEDPSLIPNPYEIMHYPWLFAGFLATFFTALNLLPIGQLDGGHVLYGLVGYKKHKLLSSIGFIAFVFYAGLGIITPFMTGNELMMYLPLYLGFLFLAFSRMYKKLQDRVTVMLSVLAGQIVFSYFFPDFNGYAGWLLFAFIIGRVLGVFHPPALYNQPLDAKRKILGWIALLVFIISFSPNPFII